MPIRLTSATPSRQNTVFRPPACGSSVPKRPGRRGRLWVRGHNARERVTASAASRASRDDRVAALGAEQRVHGRRPKTPVHVVAVARPERPTVSKRYRPGKVILLEHGVTAAVAESEGRHVEDQKLRSDTPAARRGRSCCRRRPARQVENPPGFTSRRPAGLLAQRPGRRSVPVRSAGNRRACPRPEVEAAR